MTIAIMLALAGIFSDGVVCGLEAAVAWASTGTVRQVALTLCAFQLTMLGIGAVIGAGGNRFIGKRIITNARNAFGPAPTVWPVQLRLVAPKT